eukprot:13561-Heterococcus_DN1.PRE.3
MSCNGSISLSSTVVDRKRHDQCIRLSVAHFKSSAATLRAQQQSSKAWILWENFALATNLPAGLPERSATARFVRSATARFVACGHGIERAPHSLASSTRGSVRYWN